MHLGSSTETFSLPNRWLDKLGIAARMNHSRVFRQSYIGGNYALLDKYFNPLPVRLHLLDFYLNGL